jgi:hypothetical protein
VTAVHWSALSGRSILRSVGVRRRVTGLLRGVVLCAALAVGGAGCSDDGSVGPQAATSSAPVASASPSVGHLAFTDAEIQAALAAAGTESRPPISTNSDERSVARIGAAMKTAGFDLGDEVYVLPISAAGNVLYFRIASASPLSALTDDKGRAFLQKLVSLPEIQQATVTRLAIDFQTTDTGGTFTVALTGTIADVKAALANPDGRDAKRVLFEVSRP